MSKSNYLEQKVIEHVSGIASYTSPTNFYVALFTTDPTDAGSGSEVAALDDANYARVVMTGSPEWQHNGDNSAIENINAVTFPAAAVGSNYNVTHFAIFDALTAGNMLWHAPLYVTKNVTDGVQINFAAGDIVISED